MSGGFRAEILAQALSQFYIADILTRYISDRYVLTIFRQAYQMAIDVKTMCLGVLLEGDTTGYEIQKLFKEGRYNHFLEASFGSIYPALNRLTEDGLVSCRAESQEGKPDKKVYSITQPGGQAFRAALSQSPAPDKFRSEFLFFMIFAELLEPKHLHQLVEEKIIETRERLAELATDDSFETPGAEFARGYGQTVMQATLDYLEENQKKLKSVSPDAMTDTAAE